MKFRHLIVISKPSFSNGIDHIVEKDESSDAFSSNLIYFTLFFCSNHTLVLAKDDAFHRLNKTHCEDRFIEINKFNKIKNHLLFKKTKQLVMKTKTKKLGLEKKTNQQ